MMIDVNELKARLLELDAQRAAIESEIAAHRASVIDSIAAHVSDHASLVELVEAVNRVAEPFGLRCVLRRPGGGRRRAEADTGDEGGDDDAEQSPAGPADLDF